MTVLTAPINKHTGLISVDTPLDNPSYPLFYTIDSETIEVVDQADTNQWEVERGIAGTQAAKHNRAVSLVSISSPYSGGGSSVPDPSGAPDGQRPTTRNGVYSLEPTLTGTETSARSIYVGDEDPEVAFSAALIPGDIWIDTTYGPPYATKTRNEANDGWTAQVLVIYDGSGNPLPRIGFGPFGEVPENTGDIHLIAAGEAASIQILAAGNMHLYAGDEAIKIDNGLVRLDADAGDTRLDLGAIGGAGGQTGLLLNTKPIGTQAAAVEDLALTVSDPPTQAEVQSVADKIDELLAALRASGELAP